MDESLFQWADSHKTEYRSKKRWQIIATVLCLVAALCTAYALSTPAITMENVVYCGLEEHAEHGASCYNENGELVCTQELHTHSLQCFSDPKADIETAEIWEQTVNCAQLSGNKAADAAAIAMTQLGYSESELNYEVCDGTLKRGYTRYGEWYGEPYMDWDSAFCAFCYSYAGVTKAEMPAAPDSASLLKAVKARGLLADEGYMPKAGDLIFTSLAGDKCRVGIVTATTVNIDGKLEGVTFVGGDYENAVQQITWSASDARIIGFGVLKNKATASASAELLAASGTGITGSGSLSNSGTYYLKNDITINSTIELGSGKTVNLDLNGHKITGSANPLFRVKGGTLTITDSASPMISTERTPGTEFGKTASYQNGKLTYYVTETEVTEPTTGATHETLVKYTVSSGGMIVGNQNGRAFEVSSGTLNLNGGYICNFKTSNNGGAVSMSGGTTNVNGAVLAANKTDACGGAIALSGGSAVLNVKSGAIAGNTSTGEGGGGVIAENSATVNLSNGYITNNLATSEDYWNGGGGVLLKSAGKLAISGGYITSNKAFGGGGAIKTWHDWGGNSTGKVEMSGGYVTANNCIGAEGGGMNINAGGALSITKGYITNNIAGAGVNDNNFQHWGGGGIFCSENSSSAVIMNSLITNNGAGGFGGGVAGCATGRIISSATNGTAIFDNEALGEHTSGGESTKNQDHHYAKENEVFMSHGYQDYFCALSTDISGSMLGGGEEKWTGSSDGVPVSTESADDYIIGGYVTGLTSRASEEDKVLAENVAKVFINGNESPTHGGGILVNGYLLLGEVSSVDVFARLELQPLRKQYVDENGTALPMQKDAFRFVVVDEFGEVVSEGTNDADGEVRFDRMLPFTKDGEYTYELYEIPPDDSLIQQDTSRYRMTVTVYKENVGEKVPWTNTPIIKYKFSNVHIVETTGNSEIYNADPGDDDAHAVGIDATGSHSFVNRKISDSGGGGGGGSSSSTPDTYVTVKKTWTDGSNNKSGITVRLLENGEQVASAVLNRNNNWKKTWSGLNADSVYTVQEDTVSGYVPSYTYTYSYQTTTVEDKTQTNGVRVYVLNNGYFVSNGTNALAANKQYIIASPDGKKLLRITEAHKDAGLTSADVLEVTRDDANNRYLASNVPNDCRFSLYPTTKDGYSYNCFANAGVSSYLLVQEAGGNYLKGTNSPDWSSAVKIDSGRLMGQFEWSRNNAWRFVIFDGSKFNTAEQISYMSREVLDASYKNYTVTNTPQAQVTYSLSIRKCELDNADNVLPGAVFEIRNGNTLLRFNKVSDGHYTYSQNGAYTELTTSTDGYIRIIGMKTGTYTVHEKQAPSGYLTAEDQTVTLDGNTPDHSMELQFADKKLTYILPESGGLGVQGVYLLGALLTAFPLISFVRLYRKQR